MILSEEDKNEVASRVNIAQQEIREILKTLADDIGAPVEVCVTPITGMNGGVICHVELIANLRISAHSEYSEEVVSMKW